MNQELRNTLELLSKHSARVNNFRLPQYDGKTAKERNKIALNEWIKDILAATPEDDKATSELYQEAWDAQRSGNPKKMLALCEMRKTTINNYIRAMSNYIGMFYETITLKDDESAEFINETDQQVAIGYLGQDSKPRLNRAVQAWTHYLVPLAFVSSQKQGYQIEDIQRGNITAAAKRTFDIAWDLNQKMDRNGYNLLTAGLGSGGVFGNFITSGPQQLQTYKAHTDIVTANLPTTNDLVMPGATSNSLFQIATVREGIRYCDKWANVFKDGALRPTGLLVVPSISAGDLLDYIDPKAARASELAEGLLDGYTMFEYAGRNWTVMPDVTINAGQIMVQLNKPVGYQFRKPSMDKEFTKTDEENNWEDRYNKAVQGLYIPVQRRVNVCRVAYQTD